jgi:hypothetical protein
VTSGRKYSRSPNEKARREIPTKRNASKLDEVRIAVSVQAPKSKVLAKHVTIDDIASFDDVKALPLSQPYLKIPETTFKNRRGKERNPQYQSKC